jgi:transcriptional regulator with XRE-family HTH domain
MTQRSFAAKLGFTEVYVSYLCNNIDFSTSTKTAQKMADVFGVKLSEFISWGEEHNKRGERSSIYFKDEAAFCDRPDKIEGCATAKKTS